MYHSQVPWLFWQGTLANPSQVLWLVRTASWPTPPMHVPWLYSRVLGPILPRYPGSYVSWPAPLRYYVLFLENLGQYLPGTSPFFQGTLTNSSQVPWPFFGLPWQSHPRPNSEMQPGYFLGYLGKPYPGPTCSMHEYDTATRTRSCVLSVHTHMACQSQGYRPIDLHPLIYAIQNLGPLLPYSVLGYSHPCGFIQTQKGSCGL